MARIFKVLGLFGLVLLAIGAGGTYLLHNIEEACWKHEATEAFQK